MTESLQVFNGKTKTATQKIVLLSWGLYAASPSVTFLVGETLPNIHKGGKMDQNKNWETSRNDSKETVPVASMGLVYLPTKLSYKYTSHDVVPC